MTLTFAENMTDIRQANRHFHNFVKKPHYHHGTFEYLRVPQIQWERYEKHYHVAVFGLPYVPEKEPVETWDHGTVSIAAMESYENPSSYMARYMVKDSVGEELTGHRRFFTSQGLYRPEEIRAESVGEILKRLNIPEECKTYEATYINNPLVGAVTYRHYDLRKRPQGAGQEESRDQHPG